MVRLWESQVGRCWSLRDNLISFFIMNPNWIHVKIIYMNNYNLVHQSSKLTFGLLLILPFIISITLIACQNKTENSGKVEDVFALIEYDARMDTIDCSRFGADWKPYPCLKLDKKTIKEVDSLFGKPITTYIDTLFYGREKNNKFYDPEIVEMISNLPFAKVTYTYRKEKGYALILYFIEDTKQDVVFYGFRYNPLTRMIE